MSVDLDIRLAGATLPWGGSRFYPQGKHPATRQLREALAWAQEVDDGGKTMAAYICHLETELAKFEVGEDRAKRDYLRAVERS